LKATSALDSFLLMDLPSSARVPNAVSYHLTVKNDGTVPLAHTTINISVSPSLGNYLIDGMSPLEIDGYTAIQTGAQFNCSSETAFPPSGQIACQIGWQGGSMAAGRVEDVILNVSLGQDSALQPIPPSITMTVTVKAVTSGGKSVEAAAPPVSVKVVGLDFASLGMRLSFQPDPVASGSPYVMTITFTNHSSLMIGGVTVRLKLALGIEPPAAWGCTGESFTYDICILPVNLPPGGSYSVSVHNAAAEPPSGGQVPLPAGPVQVHVEAITVVAGKLLYSTANGQFTVS
jgi:hypothetical protein